MQVTVKSTGAGVFSVYKAITGQAQTGFTVTPAVAPINTTLSGRGACQRLSIQNDPGSTASSLVYVGDAETKSDGSCQGQTLIVGASLSKETSNVNGVSLINSFVGVSTTGVIVNIDFQYV